MGKRKSTDLIPTIIFNWQEGDVVYFDKDGNESLYADELYLDAPHFWMCRAMIPFVYALGNARREDPNNVDKAARMEGVLQILEKVDIDLVCTHVFALTCIVFRCAEADVLEQSMSPCIVDINSLSEDTLQSLDDYRLLTTAAEAVGDNTHTALYFYVRLSQFAEKVNCLELYNYAVQAFQHGMLQACLSLNFIQLLKGIPPRDISPLFYEIIAIFLHALRNTDACGKASTQFIKKHPELIKLSNDLKGHDLEDFFKAASQSCEGVDGPTSV